MQVCVFFRSNPIKITEYKYPNDISIANGCPTVVRQLSNGCLTVVRRTAVKLDRS